MPHWVLLELHRGSRPTTIGIDLAKTVFQAYGVDAAGAAILKSRLRRGQVLVFFARLDPCLVGTEACAGAQFWARELSALGYEVRFMLSSYVKPYAKRGKTDVAGDCRWPVGINRMCADVEPFRAHGFELACAELVTRQLRPPCWFPI